MDDSQKYKVEQLKSLSDLEALILLYDEGIKALEKASEFWQEEKKDEFHERIEWVKKVVEGLRNIINVEIDPKLAAHLLKLYEYLLLRLNVSQSEIRQTLTIMEECISILGQLRDSWVEVRKQGDITDSFKTTLTSQEAKFLDIQI
jgi:flagellar secretion chaperone FliS